MKTFVICFSDPNGVLEPQTMEIHASSFFGACVKAVDFQSHFSGLILTSVTLVL